MVAEPVLFLSSDDKLRVRCNRSPLVFCVKDFIRAVCKRDIGSTAANAYWLEIQLSNLREYEFQNARVVKFIGPLEGEVVCLSASGLLILMHHLDVKHRIVNKRYKAEIQDRLQEIARDGRAAEKYVRDFDDGELDAVYASIARGEKIEVSEESEELDRVKNLVQTLITRTTEFDTINSKIKELENRKRLKSDSFNAKSLIEELGLDVPEQYTNRICQNVASQFKKKFPENETFLKRNVIYFAKKDRPEVESILRQQVFKVKSILLEKEMRIVAPGAEQ
jgi:hypothetical protein